MSTTPNLRKAAVLLRTLDGETAATMLGQLSPAEAAALRDAMRQLGPVDVDEQADVVAEFRRVRPLAAQATADGVELSLGSTEKKGEGPAAPPDPTTVARSKRFEFLERAPINVLAPYLTREHSQTVALVLSHLRPHRAAAVLAALPAKRQAEVLERLNELGDIDPESVTVVEHELAAWLEHRSGGRPRSERRSGAVASILAAADATTRNAILTNLKTHKASLAAQLTTPPPTLETTYRTVRPASVKPHLAATTMRATCSSPSPRPQAKFRSSAPVTRVDFDQLIQLDDRTLAAVLRNVDPGVLVLALAGSREDFVDRICDQMPKRVSRSFRRQLRRLGPTRLSDVEAAQRDVALAAAQQIADRRSPPAAAVTK